MNTNLFEINWEILNKLHIKSGYFINCIDLFFFLKNKWFFLSNIKNIFKSYHAQNNPYTSRPREQ